MGGHSRVRDSLAFPADEVYLEPAGVVEYAFTPSLLASADTADPAATPTTLVPPTAAAVPLVKGSDELIYADVFGAFACDAELLRDHLLASPAAAELWATAQGVEYVEVPAFVSSLTPMYLTTDVRLTSHELSDERAVPRQVVLQTGTAVLVSAAGEPRVRCASGSPLTAPVAVAAPVYVGTAWPGFDPATLVQIEPCDEPLDQFVLADTATAEAFVRPIGAAASADDPFTLAAATTTTAATTTSTTTTTVPTTTTTTTTTTTLPVASHDATAEGLVSASSRLCGSFAAGKAVDGDPTTSWISSSGDGDFSTFEWTANQDEFIGTVQIVSNAANATAKRRTDHGFAAVVVQVLDPVGAVVFEERVDLPGTPDPDVLVYPNVYGRSLRFLLEGHENPSGSGFAEMTVLVAR